jgi:hypothetical protein
MPIQRKVRNGQSRFGRELAVCLEAPDEWQNSDLSIRWDIGLRVPSLLAASQ